MKSHRFLIGIAFVSARASLSLAQPSSFTDLGTHNSVEETVVQPVTLVSATDIQWFKIVLADADAATASYSDLWTNTPGDISDSEVGIYDNSGNLVANDDDSGPSLYSQLSFGQVTPARPAVGTGQTFAGQNGTLPAGTYWLAVGRYNVTFNSSGWSVTSAYTGSQRTVTLNIHIHPAGVPSNPSGIGAATPAAGVVGTTFVAAVTVTPGTYPTSTGLAVQVDAASVDAGTITLLDNGVYPDGSAGDNIFSGSVTVGPGATMGTKALPFTITDAQNRNGAGSFNFILVPPNDNCDGALPVTEGIYAWDNSAATTDGSNPSCALSSNKDIWYRYSPSQTGSARISLCGTTFDTVVSVYDTCGGSLLACDDDACDGTNPPGSTLASIIAAVPVTSGSTYLIRVASYGTNPTGGVGTMEITLPDTSPTGTAALSSSEGHIGDTFTAYVTVVPGGNPPSTGLAVTLDAGGIDGGSVALLDDGNWPDEAAGDNVFTADVTVGPGSGFGQMSLPFTITDQQGRSGSGAASYRVLAPPPQNDDCSNALTVSEGTYSFDTSSATTDGHATCTTYNGMDIWYSYVPSATGSATISLCGTTFDTVVSVFDSCGGSQLACNDDTCSLQSQVSNVAVTAGVPVLVRVAGYQSGSSGTPHSGAGTLNITLPNTAPSGTAELSSTEGHIGDIFTAFVTVTPGGNPPSTGLAVSLDATSIDGGTLPLLDDGNWPDVQAGDNIFTADVTVGPGAGFGFLPLAFTITDLEGRTGNGTVNYTVIAPPPANDECYAPTVVGEGSYAFNNSGADTDGAGPSCQTNSHKDVWFEYVAARDGTVDIGTCSTNFDTVLSVTDTCGGSQLACDDDSCSGPGSANAALISALPVTAHTHYIIRVAAYGASPTGGAGTLDITLTPTSCPPDINGDGIVDLSDIVGVLSAYGSASGDPLWNPAADIDGNGIVDLSDLVAVLAAYGQSC